jgi:hypothetical protein
MVKLRLNLRRKRRRGKEAPQYLSPAMRSLVYRITGPSPSSAVAGGGAVNLTTASAYCSQAGAVQPLVCTTEIPLTLTTSGTYVFDVATYDAPQSCGAGGVCTSAPCVPAHASGANCSGNVLSDQTIPETLTIGAANAVTLSLGADAASLTVTPLLPGYLRGDTTELTLWGTAAQKLAIVARDADGNPIAGPGSPAIAISADASMLAAAPTELEGSGVVTLAQVASGSTTLSMKLTAPATGGGVPATNPTLVPVSLQTSAVYSGTCEYLNGSTTPIAWISSGCTGPIAASGVAAYSQGNLGNNLQIFANDPGSNDVIEVPGPGPNLIAVPGLNAPSGIAASRATGLLFIANPGATPASIVVTYPPGTGVTTISGPSTGLNAPSGVALDQSENLYVANGANDSITVYAAGQTSGDVAPIATISGAATGLNDPQGVAIGLDGTIWVANQGANTVTEYAAGANGNAAPLATITGLSSPAGVAVDAGGTIFVANAGSKTIAEYPSGSTGNATPSATLSGLSAAPSVAVVPAAVQP